MSKKSRDSETVRKLIDLGGKIGSPGLVTIVVILGSIGLMAWLNRIDWALIVLSLVGLCIFLSFEFMTRRVP